MTMSNLKLDGIRYSRVHLSLPPVLRGENSRLGEQEWKEAGERRGPEAVHAGLVCAAGSAGRLELHGCALPGDRGLRQRPR